MPIKLNSTIYTDIYGNTSTYFKANAGDTISVKHTLSSEIFLRSSSTNQMSFDAIDSTFNQSQGSFIEEGFRVGQTYTFKAVNNANVLVSSFSGTVSYVSDLQMKLTGLLNVNKADSTDLIWCIFVEQTHKSIELGLNFVENSNTQPSLQSLIDQEVTRFIYDGLDAVSVGATVNLLQTGKKSGGYSTSNVQIKRIADTLNPYGFTHNVKNWELTYDVIFTGIFSEESFIGENCLKLYSKIQFKVNTGETFGITTFELKEKSDTGFYDTGFNTEVSNVISTTSDASDLFYNKLNTVAFEIELNDDTIDFLEFGFAYITIDDDLNTNKPLSQENYLPFAKSGLFDATNVGDSIFSSVHPFDLTLTALSYSDLGGNRTYTGEITIDPNYTNSNDFGKFIEARGESERLVYLWVKAGNTNTLLFSGQMSFELPVGVEITPELTEIVNHDQNLDFSDLSTPVSNVDFCIEDDLAFITDFKIYSADENESVTVKVVATDGTDEFDLETLTFDLSTQDLSNFVTQTLQVSNNLPDTSYKKTAYLMENLALFGGEMTVRLYFPFLVHWEYWVQQLNATSVFVKNGTNNKDWFNYQTSPFEVKLKVEISRNGVTDYFYKDFSFVDYDDSTITTQIKMYDYPSMDEIFGLKKDGIIQIEAIHTFPVAYSGFPYGEITIEPSESEPRYLITTEYDANSDSPLQGISYAPRLDMTFTSSTIITLSCLLDLSQLDGDNFCITSKISEDGTDNNHIEMVKLMEDSTEKITEDLINKVTD